MSAIVEAVLAIGTLAGAVALLAFADWLTGHWHRPSPSSSPGPEALVPVPVRAGTDRVPYGTGGVYTLEGDDAA
jgi:hypothetical protein